MIVPITMTDIATKAIRLLVSLFFRVRH